MAKKTKAKKKVPQTFTKVVVVFTSSASSLKEAKIGVGKKLFSHGITGKEKSTCMEAGTEKFKEFTGVHTFSTSATISVPDSK
tara:strand:- start:313 stop:561 length:249 start_codon:yes stop_codon:yes gene_type:complete